MEILLRVMIAEDSEDDVALLLRELKRLGYKPHYQQVQTAAEMELALKREPWDIIISDYSIPSFGALPALRVLNASGLDIPLIVMSGTIGEDRAVEVLKSGAKDFIGKSMTMRLGPAIKRELADAAGRKALRESDRRLRLSEERFRTLVLAASQMVFVLRPTGEMQENSESWRAFTGQTFEEAGGRGWQDAIHSDDRSRFDEEWERANTTQTVMRVECRIVGAQKQIQFFSICAVPILHEGDAREWIITCTNITERIQMDEHVRKSQRMEALGQLAGGVAHDFNNLLTIINGRTELLIAQRQASGLPCRELEVIHKTGERAANLTRQLLAFSRQQVMQPKVLQINMIIGDFIEILSRLVPSNIKIQMELAPDVAPILADSTQIEQVLINLVVNARDAMPNGGPITIRTSNFIVQESIPGKSTANGMEIKKGHYVRLSVIDVGCGMDSKTKSRIFYPFFTTKPKGKGTGLGMSTVFGIVNQSGGHIDVDSAPGKGTTINIYLPHSTAKHAPASSSSMAPSVSGKKTILVVEDEEGIKDFICEILQSGGFQVVSSSNAEEVLAHAGAKQMDADLLLTDIMLPGMNGCDLADRLKELRPGLRVIFTSGYADQDAVQSRIMNSETGCLQKPFTRLELLAKVRAALEATPA